MADKFALARDLREIGALLTMEGENPFKVRAYDRGAQAVEGLTEDLERLVAEDRLLSVSGIGEALDGKIRAWLETGKIPLLERLRAAHPPGVVALLQVPDLGPKKIAALRAELGVASLQDLEAACLAGKVRGLKGFGEKTEQRILEGLKRLKERPAEKRIVLEEALELGAELLAHVRAHPATLRAELAGSARRGRETVGDLDVVAASADGPALGRHLVAFPRVAEVLGQGDTKTSVRLSTGVQVDLRIVPPEDFPTLLHHLTGSKAHHVKLRGLARDRGFTLSEWGLYRLADGVPESELRPEHKVAIASEEGLYAALGLAYVPPELREDQGELEAAAGGGPGLPKDLVALSDVRGLVHAHTTWSDGKATLLEMARGAEARGAQYLTITDHSRAAGYAGGLDRDRLLAQWDEIAAVQEQVKVKLLRGTEADILDDGRIDVPEELIPRFDVVIASIHSRMKMDRAQMTARLVAAMKQPFFKIWGHALGRLLGERDPFDCDAEAVLDALAASRGAIEVNGDPQRMEADPRMLRMARERNIPIVLSVDAHSVHALDYLPLAVVTARRGWIERGRVLNTLPVEAFRAAVKPAA
ncbi:MAG: DNA polymerase/3'-5' exonuclease PolX [Anaeromyxobacteraceae bacterium]